MTDSSTSKGNARFAVIIPVYNGRAYLAETLQSVCAQTHPAHDIIVVEDGSPIPAEDIVQQFPNVRYIPQSNTGVSGARNHGASLTDAEWICFLDQDDVLLPTHLEQFAEKLEFSPCTDLLYPSRYVLIQSAGEWVQEKITAAPPVAQLRNILLRKCPFPPSGICIRRSVFEQSGGFHSRYDLAEDWEFWLRCAEQGRTFVACSAPTVCYRVHPESNSHRPLPILRANTLVIQERIAPRLSWPRSMWTARQLVSRQEADAAILLRQTGNPGALLLLLRSLLRSPVGNLRRYAIALHMLSSRILAKGHELKRHESAM